MNKNQMMKGEREAEGSGERDTPGMDPLNQDQPPGEGIITLQVGESSDRLT
jgi:hypothetical protein